MAIKNAYSEKSAEQTMGDIQALLSQHGARKVSIEYDDNYEPECLSFFMDVHGVKMEFRLTVNVEGLLNAMKKDRSTPNSQANIKQARRTAWKNKYEWLQIQLAEIASNQAEMSELMLGYAVTNNGETLFKRLKNEPKMLTS